MDTPCEAILRDLGIPLECCPTCDMTNWEFHGAVDVGILTVACRTCGRRYELMTRREELIFLAKVFGRAVDVDTNDEAAKWYQRLVSRWHAYTFLQSDRPQMVCTMDGFWQEIDDDSPF